MNYRGSIIKACHYEIRKWTDFLISYTCTHVYSSWAIFWFWVYLMNVISEMYRAHLIRYLHFYSIVSRSLRRIFLSNCWWQKSDIWSQASYRYTISWAAFLEPSDSYFLFADFYMYMFNMYKNQLSRQTGSRNLTGPKTLPTIWHTYMKLVTKYHIPVINSCLEKCDEKWIIYVDLMFIHVSFITLQI
jgi:hypothetical protein